ncbi:MAG TPA: hypothetical protein VM580_32355, partial [Labilithrix sp.]|nr:hypothetical protein [Labilithrix sp.]
MSSRTRAQSELPGSDAWDSCEVYVSDLGRRHRARCIQPIRCGSSVAEASREQAQEAQKAVADGKASDP